MSYTRLTMALGPLELSVVLLPGAEQVAAELMSSALVRLAKELESAEATVLSEFSDDVESQVNQRSAILDLMRELGEGDNEPQN